MENIINQILDQRGSPDQLTLTRAQLDDFIANANKPLHHRIKTLENQVEECQNQQLACNKAFDEAVRFHSGINAKTTMDEQKSTIRTLSRLVTGTPTETMVLELENQFNCLSSELFIAHHSSRIAQEEYKKKLEKCAKELAEAQSVSGGTIDTIHELHMELNDKKQELEGVISERDNYKAMLRASHAKVSELEKELNVLKSMNKQAGEPQWVPSKRKAVDDGVAATLTNRVFAFHPKPQNNTSAHESCIANAPEALESKKKICFRYAKHGRCKGSKDCTLGAHE